MMQSISNTNFHILTRNLLIFTCNTYNNTEVKILSIDEATTMSYYKSQYEKPSQATQYSIYHCHIFYSLPFTAKRKKD